MFFVIFIGVPWVLVLYLKDENLNQATKTTVYLDVFCVVIGKDMG